MKNHSDLLFISLYMQLVYLVCKRYFFDVTVTIICIYIHTNEVNIDTTLFIQLGRS